MRMLALLAAMFLTATAFGRDVNNRKVQIAFERAFAGADNVTWFEVKDHYMAKFTLNARKITAHFDRSGTLIALSRMIDGNELPTQVMTRLVRKYQHQRIHCVMEYVVDGRTNYAITLEGDTHWTVLHSNPTGEFRQLQKLQKS
ncbi:hypothetical protein ACFOTA_08550 [Chitinophaga sp. GCM10012297]|uniref:Beta-lactamase-inhibitor-like PepSY-like domain-containing protein n=1 Tax=Chitinophaga chungangae TaxID=2821488 RepID=A0ABS3YC43_9BACT|nr:hypothetical protein [Chitinophaga chungangae]MBO9152253.1 hypothetical protein [Chitinophaga chungangae]